MDEYRQTEQANQAKQMRDMQMQQQQAQMADAQNKRAMLMQFRSQLPPDQQGQFDIDPQGFIQAMRKQKEAYTLGPGDVRYQGGDKIAEAPAARKAPEGMQYDANGDLVVIPGYLQMKKDIAGAGRAQTNIFNNTKDNFKNERDLRNDFQGLATTKAFREVQSAYDQIGVALKAESPAGDLAAATKIMKILDPGSVVRESELGMAMAATGALDRISNYANMLTTGQKLTPEQRKDFGKLAESLYTAAEGRYNQSADEYRNTASGYNLNPDQIAKPAKKSSVSSGGWSATVVK